MNLSPVPFFAITPAAKLAVRGAAQLIESGRDFASYLTHQSENPTASDDSSTASELSLSRSEQLLLPLKQFLRDQGFDSTNRIDIVADGNGNIRFDADPGLKEIAEGWLNQNPEWSNAWRNETAFRLSQLSASNSHIVTSIREEIDLRFPSPAVRQKVLL